MEAVREIAKTAETIYTAPRGGAHGKRPAKQDNRQGKPDAKKPANALAVTARIRKAKKLARSAAAGIERATQPDPGEGAGVAWRAVQELRSLTSRAQELFELHEKAVDKMSPKPSDVLKAAHSLKSTLAAMGRCADEACFAVAEGLADMARKNRELSEQIDSIESTLLSQVKEMHALSSENFGSRGGGLVYSAASLADSPFVPPKKKT